MKALSLMFFLPVICVLGL